MNDYDQKRIWKWDDVSPFFKPSEVMSQNTIRYPHLIDVIALHHLNEFRRMLDKPIFVNHRGMHLRGVRSAQEQMALRDIGGALCSTHVQGKAFDISCYGLEWKAFESACKDFWPFVKVYKDKNFIHCDNRNLISV